MLNRFLTYTGMVLIAASCALFAGVRIYNSHLEHSYEKAVEESVVYIPVSPKSVADSGVGLMELDMSGAMPASTHEDYMLSYSNVIYIPAVNIKAKVFDGVDKASLSKGAGRDVSTVEIGGYGNCVIAGHSSTRYDCIFNGLENLKIGDSVTAYGEDGTAYTYSIKYKYVVKPTETGILRTTDNSIRQITLYTCTDGGENRLVLVGEAE
ncbi:MAG: sortase [Lachnospiraceae bacterium]|nr:sortase [Lachnospiraceae bacterium]